VHIPISVGAGWRLARRLFMGRLDVHVRVHEATLEAPHRAEAFFVNVTNHSPGRPARPSHVTVLTDPPIAIINPLRPLRVLEPNGDSWETWIEKGQLPDPSQDIRALVEVRLSTGETIRSTPAVAGVDLPGAGEVPA
jgi:hypothetical protein